jgi:pyruvate kinase
MDYAVIPTLGPATETDHAVRALREAGATGFRLNTSHLALDGLHTWLDRLARAFGSPLPVPVVLDLQGSKWRLGDFAPLVLAPGTRVRLVLAARGDSADTLPVPHRDFFRAAASSNGEIVLNDAKSLLRIEETSDERVLARVERGGEISASKGITFARSEYRKEALGEKDRQVFEEMRGIAGLHYAVSYVKDAAEMARYRALLPGCRLVAKLERAGALAEAAAIAAACDEVWLCRGDLGAEVGPRAMAAAVHAFTHQVPSLPVPALLAGQVLEHMAEHPTPTRSELCYLHDALHAGYAGAVLSDETAIGRYPVEACRVAALFRGEGV